VPRARLGGCQGTESLRRGIPGCLAFRAPCLRVSGLGFRGICYPIETIDTAGTIKQE
jgi:hypothetical protein